MGKKIYKINNKGFSLIELCVGMVIIGLITAGVLQAYSLYIEKEKLIKQNNIASTVQQSLQDYAQKNGFLPCPAPIQGANAGNQYDAEARTGADGACLITNGVSRVAGSNGQQVLIGKLPAESLKLTNDYMRDAYGSYLLYAVTQSATISGSSTFGGVTVREHGIDLNSSSQTFGQIVQLATHDDALYAVVSPGENRLAARTHEGTFTQACSTLGTNEEENCNGNAVFLKSLISEGSAANPYDDLVLFDTAVGLIASLPDVVHLARGGEDYDYRSLGAGDHEFTMKKDGIVEHGGESGVGLSVPVEINSGDVLTIKNGPSGYTTDSGNIRQTKQLYINDEQVVAPAQPTGPAYGPPATPKDYIFSSGSSGYSDYYHAAGSGSEDNTSGTHYPGYSTRIWIKE